MIEEYLIHHCSPTLASLKTANLVNMPYNNFDEFTDSIDKWNKEFENKGLELLILRVNDAKALVYVYRKTKLQKDLNKSGVKEFLKENGYENNDADYCVKMLRQKLENKKEFPHEIGLFLGYPLGDVVGFINNCGKNCKISGCWKVYCNECEAIKTFTKFKKCRKLYEKLWLEGRSINKLTVAA